MITRKQCIDAAITNIAQGDEVSLRNAARSLADFCRVILSEVGLHHSGYHFIKHFSIKHRYSLLCAAIPELSEYEKLFYDIQKLRDKTEHDETFIPSAASLQSHTNKIKSLDTLFDAKILPKLVTRGKTPKEKFLDEWNVVLEMYVNLEGYPQWAAGTESIAIEEFRTIASNLRDLDNEAVNEGRVRLRDLSHELEILLEQADNAIQEASLGL